MGLRVLALGCVLASVWGCGDREEPRTETLESLTAKLVDHAHAYWANGEDAELAAIAQQRAPLWDDAAQHAPARALANAIPGTISIALPAEAQAFVEQPFDRTAVVTSGVFDDLTEGTASYRTLLGTTRLYGIDPPRDGSRVHATGFAHGDLAAIATSESTDALLTGAQWSNQKVLGVILNYTDKSSTATVATTTANWFTNSDSTAAWYSNLTNGKVTLSGAPTVPSGWSGSLTSTSATLAAGASTSVSLSATSSAGATGSSSVGITATSSTGTGSGSATYVVTVTCTHAAPTVTLNPPSKTAAAGATFTYTAAITNNDSATCASGTFSVARTVPAGWTSTLSASTVTLAPAASTNVTFAVTSPVSATALNTVSVTAANPASGSGTGSATYEIAPTCARTSPSVVLSPASQSGVAGAALTYLATITNNDNIFCATSAFTLTPTVPSGWTSSLSTTSLSITPSESATASFTVTSLASATGSSTVKLTAANVDSGSSAGTATYVVTSSCYAAPTVALTPPTQTAPAGSSVTYTATITDNDGPTCPTATFALVGEVPAGAWSAMFSSPSVTLSPGAATTVTFVVTSPENATGSSSVSVSASNALSGSATSTATYVATTPCTHGTPIIAVGPFTQSALPGDALSYTVTVVNTDKAGCADATFTLAPMLPAAWTSTLSPSLTIAAGSSATATWSVTSSASAAAGDNTLAVQATNASSGTATALATYTVASACTRAAPSVNLSPVTDTATAGTAITYVVTIQNKDTACGASDFAVDGVVPATWTKSLSKSTVTLGSGAATSVLFSVTSAASAAPSSYPLSASASSVASGTSTSSASYVVTQVCTHAAPTISLSPSTQSATAGATLGYNAIITNHDHACADATFTVSPVIPSTWTGTVSTPSISLAAGDSVTTTLTVASAAAAAPGTFTVGVSAANVDSGTASNTASYVVMPACVQAAPTLDVTPSSQTSPAGSIVTYEIAVTNNDTACGDTTFALTSALPTDWTDTLSSSPAMIPSGGTVSIVWAVNSALGAPDGSYPLSLTAANGANASTASATYVVATSSPPDGAPDAGPESDGGTSKPSGSDNGCSTSNAPGSWFALLVPLALLGRRRKREARSARC